jgi:hypothetical protein
MTIEEQLKAHTDLIGALAVNLDKLSKTVEVLADNALVHDAQIEALIHIGEKHSARLAEIAEQVANTEKQWQAYLNTLPRN